ncbi:TrbG/VirB9 family P-type conjugative transfer protein [uncultured Massilia sp.]|uniref:TrbG/VirB9 family P-type conjugative transfer protein n=1 Tax=uncultured Massilia sp. TaxID=169973 RepID=UPI0025DB812D|nr:TrbG/VirB9 family P-type conjugative transfer protein [uncultured Massilia sp.]
MKTRLMVCALAGVLSLDARAAQEPVPSKADARVRFVDYDPNNVVTIYGKVGTATMILFEPDEQLIDMVGGNTDAWQAASTGKRNGVFFKPAVKAPTTNIQVVTDRRAYTFDMRLAPANETGYLTVRFRYPATERAAEARARERERVEKLLDQGAPVRNRDYTVQGAGELAPVEAWDDGVVTYLRFAARTQLPAIYGASESDDSVKRIENFTVGADGTVAIHGVRPKLVLQSGSLVACVFNEGYDPGAPRAATNTSSPQVERIVKGERK